MTLLLKRYAGIRFFEDDDGIGIGDFGTIMARNRVEAYRFFEKLHSPEIPAVFSEKEITELHDLIERYVLNAPMEDVYMGCDNIEDIKLQDLAGRAFAGRCRILVNQSHIHTAASDRGGEVVHKEEQVKTYEDEMISFDSLDRGSGIDEINIATVSGKGEAGSLQLFTEFLSSIAAVIRRES